MTLVHSSRVLLDRTLRLRELVGLPTAWSVAWQSRRVETQNDGLGVHQALRLLEACARTLGIYPGRTTLELRSRSENVPHPLGVELLLSEVAIDFREYALLNVGCGAGLHLLQAMRHGFQYLTGVEQDETERVRCEMNLRAVSGSAKNNPRVRILGDSWSELPIPEQPLVVLISSHQPEDGLQTLAGRLRRTLAFGPRRMLVCCASRENAAQLQQSGFLFPLNPRSLWWGWTTLAPEPERCGRERVTSRPPVPARVQAWSAHPVCS